MDIKDFLFVKYIFQTKITLDFWFCMSESKDKHPIAQYVSKHTSHCNSMMHWVIHLYNDLIFMEYYLANTVLRKEKAETEKKKKIFN